jgi:hypothetical protein
MGVLHELSDADLVWRAVRNAKPKICDEAGTVRTGMASVSSDHTLWPLWTRLPAHTCVDCP